MIAARSLAVSVFCALLSMPFIHAQDLSRYREFQFGMNLPTVAKQADVKQSEAKAIHQRPAMIQELQWRPQHYLSASSPVRPSQRRPLQLLQWGTFPNGGELRSR